MGRGRGHHIGIHIGEVRELGFVERHKQARSDLAWSITVGGIGIALFIALLIFAWHFAATLFLIFAGMLLGVALNAMTGLLGRVVPLPQAVRLAIVCLTLTAMLSGVVFLGGTTIAQQATILSNTIKSQLVNAKTFLESHGVDTSFFDINSFTAAPSGSETSAPATPRRRLRRRRRRSGAAMRPSA